VRIEHLVNESEKLYLSKETEKTAFLLILRYIQSAELDSDNKIFLEKALEIANKRENEIIFQLLQGFIQLELDNIPKAGAILKRIMKFKHYYKIERQVDYAFIVLLYSFYELKRNNLRKAESYIKQFEILISGIKNNYSLKLIEAFYITKFFHQNEHAEKILSELNVDKINSSLFYFLVGNCHLKACDGLEEKQLNRVFKWNVYNLKQANEFVNTFKYKEKLDLKACELWYKVCPDKESLFRVCRYYIALKRCDKRAYEIYSLSKKESLSDGNLDFYYIYSAFKSGIINDIDMQSLQRVLKSCCRL